ncbi:MAG: mycofactocin precursor MftA [Marmoricola sp.]
MAQHLHSEEPQDSTQTEDLDSGQLAAEELVEEVSIDGMCGVY